MSRACRVTRARLTLSCTCRSTLEEARTAEDEEEEDELPCGSDDDPLAPKDPVGE